MMRPVLVLLLAAPACAQSALPDPAAVGVAIASHPAVIAADARLSAARAAARALALGPHELTASATVQRRSIETGEAFREYDASVARAVRLPGKASLDRRAGEAGIRAADDRAGDARHQAALALAEAWWDWLGAAAERQALDGAVGTLEEAARAVGRRRALRDASAMEQEQAEAAVAAARAEARTAAGREAAARATLAAQFPHLPLPARAPALPAPERPAEGFAALGALVVARSHEIGAAMADADRAQLHAARARRDRIADPSVGVRGFSEFGGAERGVGLFLSLPIGGRQRRALADQAGAEAGAMAAHAAGVRAEVAALAGRDVALAEAALAAWEDAAAAAASSGAAARRAARGHALGGLDLVDRLYAARVAQEAARAEAIARAEAWRAVTRLRIDSHTLWMHGHGEADPAAETLEGR